MGRPAMPLRDVAAEAEATIELCIPARSEHVKIARVAVAVIAARMHFTFDEVEDIKLALAEACNNAILHADLAPGAPATVRIHITPCADRLLIRVTDGGRLANAGALRVRTVSLDGLPADDLPEGGLGLMLIRSLMDEVEVEGGPHSETVVRMTKTVTHGRAAHGRAAR